MNSSEPAQRYYAFIAGAVHGPYSSDDLKAFYQPELQVCAEGTDEWRRAADFAELAELMSPTPFAAPAHSASMSHTLSSTAHVAAERESPPDEFAPKLKELWLICRHAPDELLKEQRARHWRKFFKNEQSILAAELGRRGLKK